MNDRDSSGGEVRPAVPGARRRRIVEIVSATPWLMQALRAVRSVGPPGACLGAGAVRSTVWNNLRYEKMFGLRVSLLCSLEEGVGSIYRSMAMTRATTSGQMARN